MKFLNIFILFFIIILHVGCAVNRQTLDETSSEFKSFSADGSFIFSDPPSDKARIYFFRDNSKVGAYLGYTIRIEYEPKLNTQGSPKYENYQDSLGYLSPTRTFFADIYAGRKVAIMAKTEVISYIIFTPQKGKIYCIKGDMKNGIGMPRPNLHFVGKIECEEAWIDYFKAENLDFQNQWRKVYNERGDKILSGPPFIESTQSIQPITQEKIESKDEKTNKKNLPTQIKNKK